MANMLNLNCLVHGDDTSHIFIIEIESTKTVHALKKIIKSEKPSTFNDLDADRLELWQVNVPPNKDEEQHLQSAESAESATPLMPRTLLSEVFEDPPQENLHIIVKRPPPDISISVVITDATHPLSGGASAVIADLERDHHDLFNCLQAKVSELQQWTKGDVLRNLEGGIYVDHEDDRPPVIEFITDIEEFLGQSRIYGLQWAGNKHFEDALAYSEQFDKIYERFSPSTLPPVVEIETDREFVAFCNILETFLEDIDAIKEDASSTLKARNFIGSFVSPAFFSQRNATFQFQEQMPWNFPIFLTTRDMSGQWCKFHPKNDVTIISRSFRCPLILSEVASQVDESDRWRMLIEAIPVARAGQHLMKENQKFFVVAIYLTSDMTAERFVVMQTGEGREVSIAKKDFNLTVPDDAISFHREMYNLATQLKGLVGNFNQHRIRRLSAIQVGSSKVMSLTQASQKRKQPSKSTHEHDDNDEAGSGGTFGDGLDVFSAGDIQAILKAEKYKIDFIPFGYPRIAAVSSVIHHSKKGYLKFVREGKEIEILQYLTQIVSPSNHTITGVRIWPVRGGNVVSMPAAGCLLTSLRNPDAHMWSVAEQLFEGVNFMHEHGVAHADLKPENILIPLNDGRLSIIDFSTSLRVKSVDDMFTGVVGTNGYIPPEVAADHSLYSAVRADLWSCGKTLQVFLRHCRPSRSRDVLLEIAQQLMSEDPAKRPMMSDVLARLTYCKADV